MKSISIYRRSGGLIAAFLATAALASATITVDGTRNAGIETEYSALSVQGITSNWGNNNALANIHAAQVGKMLNLFIAGRADGNAFTLFIDSKAGGVSTITNDLIRSGGFESDLNHFAPDSGTGMTFETGFQPDYAIRIYGGGTAAYASIYDLNKRTRSDLGQVDNATASHGPVSALRVSWADAGAPLSNVTTGVEMALNMALLGVPEGAGTVKLMAILANGDSTYGSNQCLGSLSTSNDMAGGVRGFDFQNESGTQTLSVAVNRPALVTGDDEDGDGFINSGDATPLDPERNVLFSVNMNVEHAKGGFYPPSSVKVQFFTGARTPLSTLTLTDPDGDLVYTGTLTGVRGFAGDSFGTYKFITDDSHNTNSGYEYGLDRTFTLGAANTTQTLGTVFFSNDSTINYSTWAAVNAGGQDASLDKDGDGVANGVEYFMGETGSSFTANPQPVANVVSWPRSSIATGVTFRVFTSSDLSSWTDVTANADTSNPAFVRYTLPPNAPALFVRLQVALP